MTKVSKTITSDDNADIALWDTHASKQSRYYDLQTIARAFQHVFASAFMAVSEIHRQDGETSILPGCCESSFCTVPGYMVEDKDTIVLERARSDSTRSQSSAARQRPLGFAVNHDSLMDDEGRKVIIVRGRGDMSSSGYHLRLQKMSESSCSSISLNPSSSSVQSDPRSYQELLQTSKSMRGISE